MPTTPKRVRLEMGGDHLEGYLRPVVGALTAAASNTGYPSLGSEVFLMKARIQRSSKRGKADGLTASDKAFLGMVIGDALNSLVNRPELAVKPGDRIILTINPPTGKDVKVKPPVPQPQEILTLTGGIALSATVDDGSGSASGDSVTATLPGDLTGAPTKEIPWKRTPASYKGLPVTVEIVVPTLDEYFAIFEGFKKQAKKNRGA